MHCLPKLFVVITAVGALSLAASSHAGLVAHWPFDEATQPNAAASIGSVPADAFLQRDQSGEGFNDYRPTVNHPGVTGTSYHFGTGKNGEVFHIGSHLSAQASAGPDADNFTGITGTTNRTYSTWLRLDPTINVGNREDFTLFSHGGTGPEPPSPGNIRNKWVIRLEHEASNGNLGALRVQTNNSKKVSTAADYVTGTTDLTDGLWHHAVVSMSGTSLANDVTLYVNGSAEAKTGEHEEPNTYINTGDNVKLAIGLDNYSHRFFPGWLDDPAIWDEALTSGEIAVLHDAALSTHDYNATSFNMLKQAHDTESDVLVDGTQWTYSTTVNTGEGAGLNSSGEFVFDAAGGTGLTLIPPVDFTWNVNASGDWTQTTNWSSGVPGTNNTVNANQTVTFGPIIDSRRTVFTDSDVTVRAITFNNSNSYNVSGHGSISLVQGTAAGLPTESNITVSEGSHQFQAPVILQNDTSLDVGSEATLTFNNALNLNNNDLTKTGVGTLVINNVLGTGGGTLNCEEGFCTGSGTVNGNVNNSGGTISPGNSSGSLSAVPEPAAWFLLLLGMFGCLGLRRRFGPFVPTVDRSY